MWRPDRTGGRPTPADLAELELLERVLSGVRAGDPAGEHAGLAQLVAAVRDDHPPLRPAFVDELGVRVSAGFGRRPGWRRAGRRSPSGPRPGRRRRIRVPARVAGWGARRQWGLGLGAAAAVAVVGVVLVGRVGSSPAPTSPVLPTASAPAAAGKAAAMPPARATNQSAGNAFQMPPAPVTSQPAGSPRAVQSDASISLLAPRGQVQNVADGVIAATDRLGGVVESSQVSVADVGGSQATLALEVPSAALDRALAAISALAHVSSRSQDTQDITDPTQAARERLSESRAERVALLRQLGRATTPNQVSSIHAQLGLVDGRITQDEASLQALVGRASTASVDVTIGETAHPSTGAGGAGGNGSAWRPARALHDAFRVLEACFAVLIIALAGLIPAAAVAALGWSVLRAVRRRRRQSALAGLG
jgi:uncharacterized protein DUF4349